MTRMGSVSPTDPQQPDQEEIVRILTLQGDQSRAPCRRTAKKPATKTHDCAPPILSFFRPGELSSVADPPPSESDKFPCSACGYPTILNAPESLRQCPHCDAVEYVVIDNERPPQRDVPKDSATFSFKRLSHFNEWLSQVQGRDHHSVPERAIGAVMLELKKHGVANAVDVTPSQVRTILKKIKLSKYYEHVPYILSRIRGVPPDRMPPHLEESLRQMFRRIQIPFITHSPSSRKNFLSYGYVLHKFVQLLGEERYMSKANLLKSRDKLRAQDRIWKCICKDLNWEFVPSV